MRANEGHLITGNYKNEDQKAPSVANQNTTDSDVNNLPHCLTKAGNIALETS